MPMGGWDLWLLPVHRHFDTGIGGRAERRDISSSHQPAKCVYRLPCALGPASEAVADTEVEGT